MGSSLVALRVGVVAAAVVLAAGCERPAPGPPPGSRRGVAGEIDRSAGRIEPGPGGPGSGGSGRGALDRAPPIAPPERGVDDAPPPPALRQREPVGRLVVRPPAIQVTEGRLDRAAIQRVLSSHMAEVQACYERALQRDPTLGGRIVIDFEIGPEGAVTDARQRASTMSTPQVAQCVLSLVRTWRFPAPASGPVRVTYPFVFRSAAR